MIFSMLKVHMRIISELRGKAIGYGSRRANFLFKHDHAGLIDQRTLPTFLALTVNLGECSRIAFLLANK